jgi:glycine cleavage system H protein
MSILFALFTFLIVISVGYFMRERQPAAQVAVLEARAPMPIRAVSTQPKADWAARPIAAFEAPKDYAFHPGHTWVMNEGHENARIGLDGFATNLLGKIDKIEIMGLNRWVRQGQKLGSITANGKTMDIMSPIEGVVTTMNHDALRDPEVLTTDPYGAGWICTVKAPEMTSNFRNLFRGDMVAAWMGESLRRLNTYAAPLGAAVADGGVPVPGLMAKLDAATQQAMIHEFFLN